MAKLTYNATKVSQLDHVLAEASKAIPHAPKKGWISEIRSCLLINTVQLAKLLGVGPSVVSRLESSEVSQTITLRSLNKAASALGCEVRYILVPKAPLGERLWKQAKKTLSKENKLVAHTMRLEQQETKKSDELEDDIRAAILLHEKGGKIWDE